MDLFASLKSYAQVVESGSFARAAERLSLSTTAISKHVADLETHLQTRLLNRTTRKLSMTESGQAFYGRCVQLLQDMEEAEEEAAGAAGTPRGTLRLTAPVNFGVRQVAPAIAEFSMRQPDMKFDVQLSDRIVDLVEEGFDLAIRIGRPGSENLVARRLGEIRVVVCASPDYLKLHGTPSTPDELTHHNCFTYEYSVPRSQWRLRDGDGREHQVQVSGSMHSNNGDLLAEAAAHGGGVAWLPDFIVSDYLHSGRLVPLLPEYDGLTLPIYAVYPSRKHLSAKVRVFVDFLLARFAS
jgi:DNA-binding transcriptional LysR family regulator